MYIKSKNSKKTLIKKSPIGGILDKKQRKMVKNDKKSESNVIKIGEKDLAPYILAMVFKGQPNIYNKFNNEIKIQVAKSRLAKANYLIELFKNWGLMEIERTQKNITIIPEKGDPYELEDAYEIRVKKIPAIES